MKIDLKKIPRQPIARGHFEWNPYTQEADEYWLLHCPVCDDVVSYSETDSFDDNKYPIDKYCRSCGQRISKEYTFE